MPLSAHPCPILGLSVSLCEHFTRLTHLIPPGLHAHRSKHQGETLGPHPKFPGERIQPAWLGSGLYPGPVSHCQGSEFLERHLRPDFVDLLVGGKWGLPSEKVIVGEADIFSH